MRESDLWKPGDVVECCVSGDHVKLGQQYRITETFDAGWTTLVRLEGVASPVTASHFRKRRNENDEERIAKLIRDRYTRMRIDRMQDGGFAIVCEDDIVGRLSGSALVICEALAERLNQRQAVEVHRVNGDGEQAGCVSGFCD